MPEVADESGLPEGWVLSKGITRDIGDDWQGNRRSALLEVPSVIAPATRNVLLNPEHLDAKHVTVRASTLFALEPRLRQLTGYALSYREAGAFNPKQ